MSDLISRQDAIDAFWKLEVELRPSTINAVLDMLEHLPSAEKKGEWISCGDCKHYKIDHPRANGYHCCYRIHNAFPMKPDDYCSYGERKEDDKDE